ncbi:hypothetical protein QRO08_11960 [Paracidovorax citrulli]|uniref:Plasmid-related protein n=2 Tax=Paracidovorax citrulli TaxID=80869 RepID=A1TQV7_PARC0|nr:hypothetical protein [Paracidovorax citrulli]ABM33345.1 plasmid-related protein [Paracidovorax citrulli AAC00-1]ATG92733.1 hypothetical protein CQB05_00605 [Paracidovorax citrulli]MVT28876.1 hypothetical protein [Paracidovorax citrulli]MVT36556.1 hypothetical protein [Paracidovorax citrulli]PVY62859.1 hypothetical protein C8E08_0122 [Paracidovorax citrulli]
MSAADDHGPAGFDETLWAHRCAELAARARGRSGAVWELYVRNLSADVDEVMPTVPTAARQRAAEIARDFGYETREVLAAEAPHPGQCAHFLPFDSCPLGCGSVEEHE